MIGTVGVQVLTAYFAVNFEQAEGCLEGSRFAAYATDQATFALLSFGGFHVSRSHTR
jgi:hypothetical protein